MDPYDRFHRLLKSRLQPRLRDEGFKGSGTTLRRIAGERIDVLNIQGSRYGGQCCVNFGVHFSFLPSAGGSVIDLKKIQEYQCEFRDRLHEPPESDHWWAYGETDADAEGSVASLVEMYERRGALFFGKFEPFPDAFERIAPIDIESGDLSALLGYLTGVRAALTMARIMKHIGRVERSREFAAVGLKNLGRGMGLKSELERLRDAR